MWRGEAWRKICTESVGTGPFMRSAEDVASGGKRVATPLSIASTAPPPPVPWMGRRIGEQEVRRRSSPPLFYPDFLSFFRIQGARGGGGERELEGAFGVLAQAPPEGLRVAGQTETHTLQGFTLTSRTTVSPAAAFPLIRATCFRFRKAA